MPLGRDSMIRPSWTHFCSPDLSAFAAVEMAGTAGRSGGGRRKERARWNGGRVRGEKLVRKGEGEEGRGW